MYQWVKIDVTAIPLRSLSGGALKVYLAMVFNMDESGSSACSYVRLCAALNISRRTAIRAIGELEEYQLVEKTNGPGQILTVRVLQGAAVGKNQQPNKIISNSRPPFQIPDPEHAEWVVQSDAASRSRR